MKKYYVAPTVFSFCPYINLSGTQLYFTEFLRSFKAAPSGVYSSSHSLWHTFLNCNKIMEEFAALHILTRLTKTT